MISINDYDIKLIEDEIMLIYDSPSSDYRNCRSLLSLRKDMINKRVLAHQEVILPDIIAFNDALTNALHEMYDRAHRMWDSIKDNKDFCDDAELEAKCFLSHDYPELHPVQGKDRQELWDAICDDGWNMLYDDGVSLGTLRLPVYDESFESFIGMDGETRNWNEGLDRELTKELHLTSAFHNLFEHMEFAITDFIYIRKFETEIKTEINKTVENGK